MNDDNLGANNNNPNTEPSPANSPSTPPIPPSIPPVPPSTPPIPPLTSPAPPPAQSPNNAASSSQEATPTIITTAVTSSSQLFLSPDPVYEVDVVQTPEPVSTKVEDPEFLDPNLSPIPPVKRIKKPIAIAISILLISLVAAIGIVIFVVNNPDNSTIVKSAIESLRKANSVTLTGSVKPEINRTVLEFLKQVGLDAKSLDLNFTIAKQTLPTSGQINLALILNKDERKYNLTIDFIIDEKSNVYLKTPNLENLIPLTAKIKLLDGLSKTDKNGLTGYAHLMSLVREVQDKWWKIPGDQKASSDDDVSPKDLTDKIQSSISKIKISSANLTENKHQIILSNALDLDEIKIDNVKIQDRLTIDKKTRQFTGIDLSASVGDLENVVSFNGKITISKTRKEVKVPNNAKDFKELIAPGFTIFTIIVSSNDDTDKESGFTSSSKCSEYQGADPTDKCYRPGCKSAIETQTDKKCLKGKN